MSDKPGSRSIFPAGELPKPEVDEGPWDGRVAYRGSGEDESARRFGYILVRAPFVPRSAGTSEQEHEDAIRTELIRALDAAGIPGGGSPDHLAGRWWTVHVTPGEEPYWADRVEDEGLPAEVDHVLFGDELRAAPFGASPFGASPFGASPFGASPFGASPFGASPFGASPFGASPFGASPFGASDYAAAFTGNPTYGNPIPWAGYKTAGLRPSSARVAPAPHYCEDLRKSPANVVVIDTGLAGPAIAKTFANTELTNRGLPPGDDVPDLKPVDGFMDPVAGHGTFIAGIIELLGYPTTLDSVRAISTYGDVSVKEVVRVLEQLTALGRAKEEQNKNLIVNLSFGSRARSDMRCLKEFVSDLLRTEAVIVASAGNNASFRRTYPAALDGVVSVGGLGPFGPAPFTNYGDWVRACAPAVDVVSTFFEDFNGRALTPDAMGDPDRFSGWAVWSGTSFAAPAVVAALCREMSDCGCSARTAVEHVIDNPARYRIMGLGTVVNLTTSPAYEEIVVPPGRWVVPPDQRIEEHETMLVAIAKVVEEHSKLLVREPGPGEDVMGQRAAAACSEEGRGQEGRGKEEGAGEEGAGEEGHSEEGHSEGGAAALIASQPSRNGVR